MYNCTTGRCVATVGYVVQSTTHEQEKTKGPILSILSQEGEVNVQKEKIKKKKKPRNLAKNVKASPLAQNSLGPLTKIHGNKKNCIPN